MADALDAASVGEAPPVPLADTNAFVMRWQDKTCRLPGKVQFKFFERLARRPNRP